MITVLNKPQQSISSADTSTNVINTVYKKIVGKYPRATTIFDYGCGKYNSNIDFATENDFIWFGIDPYNRSAEWNKVNIDAMNKWCNTPDIIMLNNVLNVLKEDSIVLHVLNQVYQFAGDNTDIYITIYEGDKSNIGKVTTKGYQRNEKVSKYVDYICEFFDIKEKIGSNILRVRKVR